MELRLAEYCIKRNKKFIKEREMERDKEKKNKDRVKE